VDGWETGWETDGVLADDDRKTQTARNAKSLKWVCHIGTRDTHGIKQDTQGVTWPPGLALFVVSVRRAAHGSWGQQQRWAQKSVDKRGPTARQGIGCRGFCQVPVAARREQVSGLS
jgi:hypothetical protein